MNKRTLGLSFEGFIRFAIKIYEKHKKVFNSKGGKRKAKGGLGANMYRKRKRSVESKRNNNEAPSNSFLTIKRKRIHLALIL